MQRLFLTVQPMMRRVMARMRAADRCPRHVAAKDESPRTLSADGSTVLIAAIGGDVGLASLGLELSRILEQVDKLLAHAPVMCIVLYFIIFYYG